MKTKDECYREALDESPYGILTYETALRAMDKYAESYHKEKVNRVTDEDIENMAESFMDRRALPECIAIEAIHVFKSKLMEE